MAQYSIGADTFNGQPGMPTHYPVTFDKSKLDRDALMAPDIQPTFSAASFIAKGAVLEGRALNHTGPLALIELQNAGALAHLCGRHRQLLRHHPLQLEQLLRDSRD